MLVEGPKVVLQNKHVDKFVKSFKEPEQAPEVVGLDESFDATQHFLNQQVFQLRLPSDISRPEPSKKDLISLSDIIAHDEFLAVSQQFEVKKPADGSKRYFTITKQPVTLAEKECSVLVIHEQTEFFQLEKVREHNEGIRFANKCVVH